jgi:hypothetical protein
LLKKSGTGIPCSAFRMLLGYAIVIYSPKASIILSAVARIIVSLM